MSRASASGRGHGPHRGHQSGQGQHAGDPAGGPGARLGALLCRAEGPVAARRRRLGPPGAAPGVRRSACLVRARRGRGRETGRVRRHPDAQGSAVRHRIHLHHLHPGSRPRSGRAGLQPPAGAARHEREGLHGLVPGMLRADPDHARHARHERIPARARQGGLQAAARHGRPLDLRARPGRQEPQRRVRDADRLRQALRHRAALPAGDRDRRRLPGDPGRRRAGALRPAAHARRGRPPRQSRRGSPRREPAAQRARPLAVLRHRPEAARGGHDLRRTGRHRRLRH